MPLSVGSKPTNAATAMANAFALNMWSIDMPRDDLKSLQKHLGLGNQALADALDLSLSTVAKYRSGALDVPLTVILAMRFLLLDRAISSL
jgi:hypothetical protein